MIGSVNVFPFQLSTGSIIGLFSPSLFLYAPRASSRLVSSGLGDRFGPLSISRSHGCEQKMISMSGKVSWGRGRGLGCLSGGTV